MANKHPAEDTVDELALSSTQSIAAVSVTPRPKRVRQAPKRLEEEAKIPITTPTKTPRSQTLTRKSGRKKSIIDTFNWDPKHIMTSKSSLYGKIDLVVRWDSYYIPCNSTYQKIDLDTDTSCKNRNF
jgi:hypothetical protein